MDGWMDGFISITYVCFAIFSIYPLPPPPPDTVNNVQITSFSFSSKSLIVLLMKRKYILPPGSLKLDLHSPHHKVETCSRNCILFLFLFFFLPESISPLRDYEWQRAQSAVSSICKSMLRFNLFTLPSAWTHSLNSESATEELLFFFCGHTWL